MNRPPCRPDHGTGNRYPDSTRELAFEVWAFECGRDATATAARLGLRLARSEPSPDARTVRRWARSGGWHAEADARLRAVAPNLAANTRVLLALAANESALITPRHDFLYAGGAHRCPTGATRLEQIRTNHLRRRFAVEIVGPCDPQRLVEAQASKFANRPEDLADDVVIRKPLQVVLDEPDTALERFSPFLLR
jgi:hypothetical protein